MTGLDRLIQNWRIKKCLPYINQGDRVLDVGCADGALFRHVGKKLGQGLGIDPDLKAPQKGSNYSLISGIIPEALSGEPPFDVIAVLAVLEHVPTAAQAPFAKACADWLKPGGRLVITVPSAMVDPILTGLRFFKLIDGMQLEEHYGYDVRKTPTLFQENGLELLRWSSFQCGLNNLFVFKKPS